MGLWLALILCIALSAFFSATETAYSACNRVKLKTVDGPRKGKAQTALGLLEEYDSLITTVLIGNNLVNIVGTAIATLLFTTRILPGQEDLATTVASVMMTVLVLFLGEVGPKTLAKQQPEKYAMAVSGVIRVLVTVLRPLDWLFALWRKLLAKMIKPEQEESQIEDELMTMIDEAQTEGDIEEEEGELIRSAIEFNDQNAADIMTPRVDVTALEDNATIEEAADAFRDTWFSRIPVYHEDLDHVIGILHEKDFYKMTHEGVTDITKIMKEPVFAPASLSISNLLKLFRTSQTHLVILLDEYGGTDGIVTMEDVLEELVGEIYDEHDEVSEEVVEQEDGTLIVDGNMQLQELLVTEDYIEEIYRAFDAGEKEQVVEKIQTLHKMSREFHDIRIKWENYLMGYIYEEIGGDDLYEAMRKVVSSYNAAPIETAREGDFRKRVEQTIWGLHSHGEPLYAIEDDEKVSVYMNPCGSGQMLVESGCFSSPDKGRYVGPHRITWQMEHFPAYCVHAPVQEILSIEALGFPYFVNCPCQELKDPNWKFAHQSCAFSVYKDNNAIPDEVYQRLGLEKPVITLKNHNL